METKAERATYIVPGMNLAYLLEQIAKLNKRCTKLGIPEITVTTEHDHTLHLYRNPLNDFKCWLAEVDIPTKVCGMVAVGQVREMWEVTITGTAPKYAGWRFIATLEPLAAAGTETLNLVMTVPGEKCPVAFMRAEHVGRCDHCNAKRMRKQTFVVQHDDGTFKAVGRQCIKDFLGHEDPNRLAAWAELLIELGGMAAGSQDEGWLGGGRQEPAWDLEFYLGWVAGVIRTQGWTSRTKVKENGGGATVDTVNWILNPPVKFTDAKEEKEWRELRDACTPTAGDLAEAAEALTWALELDIEKLLTAGSADNYLANVAALARARVVGRKTCGLGGSIVAAAAKARDRAKQAAQAAQKPASVHVGTVGVRAVYRVRCERIIPIEGQYGITYITKMTAWDEGRGAYANDMVWFASSKNIMAAHKP